jgi:Ras family protein T1
LLRRFVNKHMAGGEDGLGVYEPTTKVLSVVNSVEMEGVEKYLVVSVPRLIRRLKACVERGQLQEFGSKYESETLRNSKKLDMADIIIYVHDSSDTNSFSYISNLRVSPFAADH